MREIDQNLFDASRDGDLEKAKRALENGANVNFKWDYGTTPLHQASQNGHDAVVSLLLDKGANVHVKGFLGMTPLHRASWEGYEVIVFLLLDKGADVNAINKSGNTPLHCASENGKEAVVSLLLKKGANVHARNYDGDTPLRWATVLGHKAIISLLLENGADDSIAGNYGESSIPSIASTTSYTDEEGDLHRTFQNEVSLSSRRFSLESSDSDNDPDTEWLRLIQVSEEQEFFEVDHSQPMRGRCWSEPMLQLQEQKKKYVPIDFLSKQKYSHHSFTSQKQFTESTSPQQLLHESHGIFQERILLDDSIPLIKLAHPLNRSEGSQRDSDLDSSLSSQGSSLYAEDDLAQQDRALPEGITFHQQARGSYESRRQPRQPDVSATEAVYLPSRPASASLDAGPCWSQLKSSHAEIGSSRDLSLPKFATGSIEIDTLVKRKDIFSLTCMLRAQGDKRLDSALALMR
jgi:hypothetical protein